MTQEDNIIKQEDKSENADYNILNIEGTEYLTQFNKSYVNRKKWVKENPYEIRSVIPGKVLEIIVNAGDKVIKGQNLLILEAMKMQNRIKAPTDGVVKHIFVKEGVNVPKNELLIELEK